MRSKLQSAIRRVPNRTARSRAHYANVDDAMNRPEGKSGPLAPAVAALSETAEEAGQGRINYARAEGIAGIQDDSEEQDLEAGTQVQGQIDFFLQHTESPGEGHRGLTTPKASINMEGVVVQGRYDQCAEPCGPGCHRTGRGVD